MTDDPLSIVRQLGAVFDALEIPWVVGGSLASSIYGEPRSTNDADLIVALPASKVPALAREATDFYIDADTLERQLRSGRSYNIFHTPTMTKVDLFPAVGAFERSQLERARSLAGVRLLAPEDAVLAKLRWYRAGGELSARQLADVEAIVALRGDTLDREYLETWATALGVADLLASVLEGQPR